jgi:UDP-N-acetylglucosamine 2-epimerase (non-hydrolysing)
MHKISVIFGTRPEAIKLAPVVLALRQQPNVECLVCVTAQHRQLLDQVLQVFDLRPDSDLNLMQQRQTLPGFTALAVTALDRYLSAERPRLVIVQGDTSTALCAALTAFYHRIPVAHVEAGLRTWNLEAPWPEEANRVLTSRLAALHFAPTKRNRENLIRENTPPRRIWVTGNTVIDALLLARKRIRSDPPSIPGLPACIQPHGNASSSTQWALPRLVLITSHRRENFGEGLASICQAIAELAARFPEIHFVYPLHLNPIVQETARRYLGKGIDPHGKGRKHTNVHLIEPLSYLEFIALMDRAEVILTDSGGIQEEAPSLGKPVLVLRDTTERPEAVEAGTVLLVGTNTRKIVRVTSHLLRDESARENMKKKRNPYGDGRAAKRIVDHCVKFLRERGAAKKS